MAPPKLPNKGNTCHLNVIHQLMIRCGIPNINKKDVMKNYKIHEQQDAIETLQVIMNTMEYGEGTPIMKQRQLIDLLNPSVIPNSKDMVMTMYPKDKKINTLFNGHMVNILHCCDCKTNSYTLHTFIELVISNNSDSISNGLISLFQSELLNDKIMCDVCNVNTTRIKKLALISLPKYLIIVTHKKKHKSLSIDPILFFDSSLVYDVIGIVMHHGRLFTSGHYTCFINDDDNQWWHCNDSIIQKTSMDQINELSSFHSSPCIILYEQRGNN